MYISTYLRKYDPWHPKQLGFCMEKNRFSSRQFSNSSPVQELSMSDPSPHQPYHRKLTTGCRPNSSLGYLEPTISCSRSGESFLEEDAGS